MQLYEGLKIDIADRQCICFVGAGGKTTAMFRLAKELRALGKRVLVTTTTRIFYPERDLCDAVAIIEAPGEAESYVNNISAPGIYVIAKGVTEDNKLVGYDNTVISGIFASSNIGYVLVEGDGSKRKPVKAPAAHEPFIPECCDMVLGLIGLDCLGEQASEASVHRLDYFCKVCGCSEGDMIDEGMLAKLIIHPEGLFKNTPFASKKVVLLNKADNAERTERAKRIKNMARDYPASVAVTCLNKDNPIID
ncbi:MAG: selenium cofactor biosynthesis protein YqeC [Caulobacteraceae bacterium]